MAKKSVLTRDDLLNLGSLITYKDREDEQCLGNLLYFEGHGVFEPNFGKIDITTEEAEAHNKALDEAMIKGLDENCEIGQGGFFYHTDTQIRTFTGLVVSEDVDFRGKVIIFRRNGMTFRGVVSKDADCFDFRRIA